MECHGESDGNFLTSGAYFEMGFIGELLNYEFNQLGLFGGIGAKYIDAYSGGSGGIGGTGGIVNVKNINQIHAYNGSYITTVDSSTQNEDWRKTNESIIYAQLGYNLETLRADTIEDATGSTTTKITEIISRTALDLMTELGSNYRNIDYSVYTTYGKMGIGAGAGCIEGTNGSLNIIN